MFYEITVEAAGGPQTGTCVCVWVVRVSSDEAPLRLLSVTDLLLVISAGINQHSPVTCYYGILQDCPMLFQILVLSAFESKLE